MGEKLITFKEYWFNLVYRRATRDAWKYTKDHLAMALLIVLGAVVTSLLSANGILNEAVSNGYISDASSAMRLVGALFILVLLYLGWSTLYLPVILYREQEKEKGNLKTKIKRLQKLQDGKDSLKYYDGIEISHLVLALTIDEKRAERSAIRPMEERRLPYLIKNVGGIGIRGCRIRMTSLLWLEGPHYYGNDTGNVPAEDKSIKWKNSDKERIDLGIDSSEPIILAKVPDYNAIPIFHFITFGDENKSLNEQVARTFEGTWNVNIQIEGRIEESGITIDMLPIPYTISFKFEDFSLIPLEIVKHKRQAKLPTTT